MQGADFLSQILGLLQNNGAINGNHGNFGPRMDMGRYTGKVMTPEEERLYKMQMYQPNGYAGQQQFDFNRYNQSFPSRT